jgi:UDP-N-acetylmuramoyl-L-alanyl-D-glutamate--2,6-diaminopimelate ligase
MQAILDLIKKILPKSWLKKIRPVWHGFLSYLAAIYYKHPSDKLIVVGVTGTAGKSTTVQMLSHILNASGQRAGYVTTVGFSDGNKEFINKHGLSMPGRFLLQKNLKQILNNECKIAIVEATSEGLAQNRHLGISFDMALFTNLAPAHVQAHGSFENYKKAKGRLFEALGKSEGKINFPKKVIGVNLDDINAEYFLHFPADQKFGISFGKPAEEVDMANKKVGTELVSRLDQVYQANDLVEDREKTSFALEDVKFELGLPGVFNAYNALLAIAAANALGVPLNESAIALTKFKGAAGRMQKIENEFGIDIFLDYAPEPVAMKNALLALQNIPHQRLIHVFGSTGGHRDAQKRFEFGDISAELTDLIIITNDDVYSSNPKEIADNIEQGIARAVNKRVKEVFVILDRKEAIFKAVELAEPGDIVIFTGKGSEQFLVLPDNRRIPWDERTVIEEAIKAKKGKQ